MSGHFYDTLDDVFTACFRKEMSSNLAGGDPLPHVIPVDVIVFFVGVVQQPLRKVFSPHGVHTFGELQELHLLDLSLQVLHEPEEHK